MSALCHLERYHKNPHRDGKYFGFSKDAEYPSLYENPDSQYENIRKGDVIEYEYPKLYNVRPNVKEQVDEFFEIHSKKDIIIIRKTNDKFYYKYRVNIVNVDFNHKGEKILRLMVTRVYDI
jgi:hypothetical protein